MGFVLPRLPYIVVCQVTGDVMQIARILPRRGEVGVRSGGRSLRECLWRQNPRGLRRAG
ncbi:hypothetical protein SBA4_1110007 [Candidatus Sulfopaludibacter sp. SbA4]|nr:hypothetical protein SBA4_1110007 [Candidatus Sulfopaludibacter sp. SbA4]